MSILDNQTLRYSQISLLTGLKRHALNARARANIDKESIQRNSGNQILLKPSQTKQLIQDRINNLKGKIIYIGNLKGGVGKTTIAYLLSNALSAIGFKTCVIDLDVQANLTHQYMQIDVNQSVFYDVVDNKKKINEVIIRINDYLDFIPSSLKNSLIQKALSLQSPKHHLTWFNNICLNYLRETYDVVIVDTPPNLTTLNSVFCLCLQDGDDILIPACAEDFSIMGVQMFLDDILDIRTSYQVSSSPNISIVINKFLQNQKTNLEMLVKMGQAYSGMVSEIIIKDSAKIREAVNNKIPFHEIKQGREIYEVISNLLRDLNILKQQ